MPIGLKARVLRDAIEKAQGSMISGREMITGDELADIITDIALEACVKLPYGMQDLFNKSRANRKGLFGIDRSFAIMLRAAEGVSD